MEKNPCQKPELRQCCGIMCSVHYYYYFAAVRITCFLKIAGDMLVTIGPLETAWDHRGL